MNTISCVSPSNPCPDGSRAGIYCSWKQNTKNTVCIFIKKQNRMSDTRGETIRHNMQKNTCIFVKHVKN